MYPHRYKFGKQKTIMPLPEFEAALKKAADNGEPLENLAYVVFIWYYGVRKSEGYERLLSDVTVTKDSVVVDFHTRKKHGLEVPPNEASREWFGVNDYLVSWIQSALDKPMKKRLFFQEPIGKFHMTKPTAQRPKGTRVEIKRHVSRVEKAVWLFPDVASTKAWEIFKRVLGEKFYPHYGRLWRLSKAAQTAENMGDMISAVRRVSGLKSLNAMEAYFGDDEEVGKKAMRELK